VTVVRSLIDTLQGSRSSSRNAGQVCLRVEQVTATDDVVQLRYSVSDAGRGIPAGMHLRIFEPFVRVASSRRCVRVCGSRAGPAEASRSILRNETACAPSRAGHVPIRHS
jgi:signal transduction histidine kinase